MGIETKDISAGRLRSFARRGTRDLRLLVSTVFALMFGFGAFTAAYSNFAVEVIRLTPKQIGALESARELPGFLVFVIAALTMRIAEPLLASIALFLVAAGIAAYYVVDGVYSLVFFSIVWSMGLHAWMTLQPSMTMSLTDEKNRGRRLGQISGIGSLGLLCGMGLVLVAGKHLGYRNIFAISGLFAAVGAVAVAGISRDIGHPGKPRLVWKRRYSLYYLLMFLEGCRKQVFMTFAIFVLVRNYHTSLRMVALLMIINSLVNIFFAPKVGRLIDRIGERKVLAFCYAALIPVFLGYALVREHTVLYALYCLDNLFFLGSIGLNTYLHRIADPGDVMPSLAMGVSMNHAAAVAVPILGGLMWARFDYPTVFLGGMVVVAASVLAALRIGAGKPVQAGPEPL